jgi:hypothetical protein
MVYGFLSMKVFSVYEIMTQHTYDHVTACKQDSLQNPDKVRVSDPEGK